jgi:hypothetical protein
MLHEISQRGRFAILMMLRECLECLGPKMLDFCRTRFPQAQTLSSLHDAKSFMSPAPVLQPSARSDKTYGADRHSIIEFDVRSPDVHH